MMATHALNTIPRRPVFGNAIARPRRMPPHAHMQLAHDPRRREDGSMARIYLKREDLNHTGAHKINNALGQALLCKRMGKTRIIAETGAGQRGVATVGGLNGDGPWTNLDAGQLCGMADREQAAGQLLAPWAAVEVAAAAAAAAGPSPLSLSGRATEASPRPCPCLRASLSLSHLHTLCPSAPRAGRRPPCARVWASSASSTWEPRTWSARSAARWLSSALCPAVCSLVCECVFSGRKQCGQ